MKTHFENLLEHVPDLERLKILDLGSGRGDFLIELAKRGVKAMGLERNEEYVRISYEKAREEGVKIEIVKGKAENLPFENNSFDFVNASEIIEHIEEPIKVLEEIYRVSVLGGKCYISVPNRFGFKDPHFKMYFINWLPRFLAEFYLSLRRAHKDYKSFQDRQKLSEMRYFTFAGFSKLAGNVGFKIIDIREEKIKKIKNRFLRNFLNIAYSLILKRFYFNTFHFLLIK